MEKSTILVVDDDKEIAELVGIYLTNDGFTVRTAVNGEDCLAQLDADPDIRLIILDIMMPGIDGLEVCRRIRSHSNIPIIMLSAKTQDMDKIIGFGTGADDYVTKPFNPLELMARVKSQLKRYEAINMPWQKKDTIAVAGLIINEEEHTVVKNDCAISLTPIEFSILLLLAKSPGKVYSSEDIFVNVWNEESFEVNNTVMVHIRRLREKIEDEPKTPRIIKTVWGVGYKLES
ncbi:MAG: response regulator transcription factor [Lachnospiraceae bacterium]|nr:response regulator transcription factor [Lachnospiraceae bacterium]